MNKRRIILLSVLFILLLGLFLQYSPMWFPVFKELLEEPWFSTFINLILAIFTGGLLLYVVFGDWLTGRYRCPDFDMTITLEPPHCHKTIARVTRIENGEEVSSGYAETYYYRIQVFNNGDAPAENVEVFASSLEKFDDESGRFSYVPSYKPSHLRWSTIHEHGLDKAMYFPRINPGGIEVANHCDLVEIFPDIDSRGRMSDNVAARLCIAMKSISPYHILDSGIYRISITVGASNASPKSKEFEINHSGKYYYDEVEMLEHGTTIKEV